MAVPVPTCGPVEVGRSHVGSGLLQRLGVLEPTPLSRRLALALLAGVVGTTDTATDKHHAALSMAQRDQSFLIQLEHSLHSNSPVGAGLEHEKTPHIRATPAWRRERAPLTTPVCECTLGRHLSSTLLPETGDVS
jgi:hypothetical protein